MTQTFAILLENGVTMPVSGPKPKARKALARWKAVRRTAMAEDWIAKPRLALGLICMDNRRITNPRTNAK